MVKICRFAMSVYFLTVIFLFLAWSDNLVSDTAITTQIESRLLTDERLNPLDINTTTEGGVVTLSGTVADEEQKRRAEELARGIYGVKRVINKLVVVSSGSVKPPKRSVKQMFSDRALAVAIRSRLLYHKEFGSIPIDVACRAGAVSLYGTVSSEEQKKNIEALVRDTRGVADVNNKLVVAPRSQTFFPEKTVARATDALLEKRVEAALLINRYTNLHDLNVSVRDGVCFLSGTVGSPEEKEAAASVAGSIIGIRGVENSIDILEQVYGVPDVFSVRMEPLTLEPE